MAGPRLVVLISAGGTTLQNLIDRIQDGRLAATIVEVISSNPGVYGIERAQRAGIPVTVLTRKECGSSEEFSRRLFDRCRAVQADLVCMAGFLQFLPIPKDFENRVMNIHPSLIPAFCGKGYYGHHVHEAALAKGVKITGCTVHFADNEYDHGPIILQKAVSIQEGDTPDTLMDRVYAQECEAYPEAIRLFGEGRLQVDGRRVRVLPERS
jgi:formyltetrahydrofolate-dependent phosphoribosylglycinamide formyltransferase